MNVPAESKVGARTDTPDWLRSSPRTGGTCECGPAGWRRGAVVAKTLNGVATLVADATNGDEIARSDGWLQHCHIRAKIVAAFAVLVTVSLVRSIGLVAVLYTVVTLAASTSCLPRGMIVRRVWLTAGLFSAVVAGPATLNVITHGTVVVPLGTWFGHPLGLTQQGLFAAAMIVARVVVSVTVVMILRLATPANQLLSGLRSFGVPAVFIVVATMAFRYVLHLVHAVDDMYTARRARTVDPARHGPDDRALVAATAGALFGRAHSLSNEVHDAMISRGYNGDVLSLPIGRAPARHQLFAAATLLMCATALVVDRVG